MNRTSPDSESQVMYELLLGISIPYILKRYKLSNRNEGLNHETLN